MCMAGDATIVRNKTSASFAIFLMIIIAFFLLHIIVVTAEQGHNAFVDVKNQGKGDATKKNMEERDPPGIGALDAHKREAPINHGSSEWGETLFNASAHEVPSGPNPISNR